MGLIDDMQALILIDAMEARQAHHVAALRKGIDREGLNEAAIAAMELMYSTGWKECIEEMRNMRSGR